MSSTGTIQQDKRRREAWSNRPRGRESRMPGRSKLVTLSGSTRCSRARASSRLHAAAMSLPAGATGRGPGPEEGNGEVASLP